MSPSRLRDLAKQIVGKKKMLAMTGAGMSTESGIPDFRSSGGLWEKYPPQEYATMEAFLAHPEKVWHMINEMQAMIRRAKPNPGHFSLTCMEQVGVLEGVITQNVDGLHERAGSKNVVCFHGSSDALVCLRCKFDFSRDSIEATENKGFPPRCRECDSILKPRVVFFGEPIEPWVLQRAGDLVDGASILLVVGTSATVAPASYIPPAAKRRGCLVIEINLEKTLLSQTCADVTILGKSGEILPELCREIEKIL